MSEIPQEIINQIIFRLPVKSLLKFRCVSHSWLALIDSPLCVKSQLSHATRKIILDNDNPSSPSALSIDLQNSRPSAELSVLELGYIVKNQTSDTTVRGSCNGIILLFHSCYEWDVSLQNPFNRSFHKIPCSEYEWPEPLSIDFVLDKFVYGLGYDSLNDDYKFVRNVQLLINVEKGFSSSVDVYSLKMDSWKKVEAFPYYVFYHYAAGVFVGGALHWVVIISRQEFSFGIMAFDIATEEYRLVQQPMYGSGKFHLSVNELGGCLVAGYNYYSIGLVDFWVMKEYGEVKSWYKLLSLSVADIGVHINDELLGFVKPVIYSECRKKVLIERARKTLLWYDLEKKSVESLELSGPYIPKTLNSFVLLESLFKLSHPDPRDAKKGAQKNDEKSNKRRKNRDAFLSTGFKLKL